MGASAFHFQIGGSKRGWPLCVVQMLPSVANGVIEVDTLVSSFIAAADCGTVLGVDCCA